MKLVEAVVEKAQNLYFKEVWGITREYPELRWSGATGLLLYSMLKEKKLKPELKGSLPPAGTGGIIFANHGSEDDITMAVIQVRKSGRFIQCFARASLLDPGIKEDPEILATTGKIHNDLDSKPSWQKQLRAKFLKDVGAISVPRGENFPLHTARHTFSRLDQGTLVASFVQQTRIPEGDLRDLFEGAAFLAHKRPNTLMIPIGISYNPYLFNIGNWITYSEAKLEAGFDIPDLSEPQRITIFMGGRIAALLPSELKDRWFDWQRQQQIDRFIAKNEETTLQRKERLRAKKEGIPQN